MQKPELECESCLGGLPKECPIKAFVESEDYYVAFNHESPFPRTLVERFVDDEGCKMYKALSEADVDGETFYVAGKK